MHCAQDPPADTTAHGNSKREEKEEKREREDNTLCKEEEFRKEARGHKGKMSQA